MADGWGQYSDPVPARPDSVLPVQDVPLPADGGVVGVESVETTTNEAE